MPGFDVGTCPEPLKDELNDKNGHEAIATHCHVIVYNRDDIRGLKYVRCATGDERTSGGHYE